jgi:hypothetical protein
MRMIDELAARECVAIYFKCACNKNHHECTQVRNQAAAAAATSMRPTAVCNRLWSIGTTNRMACRWLRAHASVFFENVGHPIERFVANVLFHNREGNYGIVWNSLQKLNANRRRNGCNRSSWAFWLCTGTHARLEHWARRIPK